MLERPVRDPDLTWAYGRHPDQVADVYLPPDPARGTVVLLHGGYWRPDYDRTHLRPMAAALAGLGHLVVSAEYRRQPGHPDATIDDLTACWRALPDLRAAHAPDRPVVLVGHSAGGHLALWLAGQVQVACLALAPVADLVRADALDLDEGAVRAFLGGPATGRPDLDPAARPAPEGDVTVLHGDVDTLVPLELSASFTSPRPGVRLEVLPGAGHFAVIDPASTAWPAVVSAVDGLSANPSVAKSAGIE